MTIIGNITHLEVQDLKPNYCSYSDLKDDLLLKLINDILDPRDDFINNINEYIGKNVIVQVPTSFGGVFTLSDLWIDYYDDYIYFGLTPTFTPPTLIFEVEIMQTLKKNDQ